MKYRIQELYFNQPDQKEPTEGEGTIMQSCKFSSQALSIPIQITFVTASGFFNGARFNFKYARQIKQE